MDKFGQVYNTYNANQYNTYVGNINNGNYGSTLQQAFFAPLMSETQSINDAFDELKSKTLVTLIITSYFIGLLTLVVLVYLINAMLKNFSMVHGHHTLFITTFIVICSTVYVVANKGTTYTEINKIANNDTGTKLRVIMPNSDLIDKLNFESTKFALFYEKYNASKQAVATQSAPKTVIDKLNKPESVASESDIATWKSNMMFHAKNIAELARYDLNFAENKKSKLIRVTVLGCLLVPVLLGSAFGFMYYSLSRDTLPVFLKGKWGLLMCFASIFFIFFVMALVYILTKIDVMSPATCTGSPSTFDDAVVKHFYDDFCTLHNVYPNMQNITPPPHTIYYYIDVAVMWFSGIISICMFIYLLVKMIRRDATLNIPVSYNSGMKYLFLTFALLLTMSVWGQYYVS